MSTQRILPKFQILNTRGQKKNCEICNVKFQLLVKQEHQCKRCMRSICQLCGPERRLVYEVDGTAQLHRNCIICIKEGDWIQLYKNSHKLCFGQDSQFVEEWINKLNKERKSYDDILDQYSDIITSITNDNIIRFKRQSQVIFKQLPESLNYSLRHFLFDVANNISPQLFQTKVKNVMIAVFGKVKSLPYVPQLVYLATYFLLFASQAHTYFILTRMIQKIYPQYVRVKRMKKDNLLSSSLKIILQMYRICVDRVDRSQLQIVAQYLQSRFSNYIISFTLNLCSIPNTFFIVDEMLKSGNYLALYKGIAGMLSYCRQQLSVYKTYDEVEIPLLRAVSLQNLKNAFVKFEKSDAQFQITNEVFDSAQHRKLYEKYKQIQSLYSKSQTTLTQKEEYIKELLGELNKRKVTIEQQKTKLIQLQQEIVKIAHQIPQLSNYQHMKQIYDKAVQVNKQLEKQCIKNRQKIDELEKQKFYSQKVNKISRQMEQDHINETVELKTKIQILQIQIAAHNIDFNTSFIEKKMKEKNQQINILQSEIQHHKSYIQFYKLQLLQKSFNTSVDLKKAMDKYDHHQKQQKQFQFTKHINISNSVINGLKSQLSQAKAKVQEQNLRIINLQQRQRTLEESLKDSQSVSEIVRQIPQEFEYGQCLTQIEKMMEKENNFMKKKTFESIIQNFAKCQKQLKYRTLDARMKQLKIKNSFLIQILNPDNNIKLAKGLQSEKEEEKQTEFENIISHIDTNQIDNAENGEKKQCSIM